MNDQQTTIQQLKDLVKEFRSKRNWDSEAPIDSAIGLVLEASEVLEHFQWGAGEEVEKNQKVYEALADEVADVLWYVFMMANRLHIDLAEAFWRKLNKNEQKWPKAVFQPGLSREERMQAYYQIKAKYRGGHPLAEEGGVK